jgi:hypothetical protein
MNIFISSQDNHHQHLFKSNLIKKQIIIIRLFNSFIKTCDLAFSNHFLTLGEKIRNTRVSNCDSLLFILHTLTDLKKSVRKILDGLEIKSVEQNISFTNSAVIYSYERKTSISITI